MMEKSSKTIADRYNEIMVRIAAAAVKSGRKAEEISLVAVTKTQSADKIKQLLEAGAGIIGENRVQELLEKKPFLEAYKHKTHLIGHLQRNKAKFLPGNISMLQSLDSVSTIEALEKAYSGFEDKLDVLIEINIGDETSKTGILPDGLESLAQRVCESPSLRFRGLMAIPPICDGDKVCVYFEQMYKLFIDIKSKKMDNNVNILSMGMSADFEYAILEGANMVRIGSELFGPRD